MGKGASVNDSDVQKVTTQQVKLSPKQQIVLDFIKKYIDEKGFPPSIRTTMEGVGYASTSTVHNILVILERKGYILRNPGGPRAVKVMDVGETAKPPKFQTFMQLVMKESRRISLMDLLEDWDIKESEYDAIVKWFNDELQIKL